MSNPPSWSDLSPDERVDCTGRPRKFTCCDKYVWDAAGSLESDWNNRILPQLNSLITHNYKQVFGKRGVQALLSLHLYLISSTTDPTTAVPIIYIRTHCPKTANRARKLIVKHDIFINLDTGFEVLFEGKSIFSMAGEVNANLCLLDGVQSLCGTSVVVVPTDEQRVSGTRQAIIFCTIRVGKQYFAILPAHVFFHEVTHWLEDDDDCLNDPTPSSPNSEDDRMTISDCSSDQDSEQGSTEDNSIEWPVPHRVYLNPSSALPGIEASDLVPLGNFDPRQQFALSPARPILCHNLDYALLEINEFEPAKPNIVLDENSNLLNVDRYDIEITSSSALLASGSHEAQQLSISTTASTLLIPRATGPLKVWELDYSLPFGHSGSPLLTQDGALLGMAVASIPDQQITYVVPASDIFEHIWTIMHPTDAHESEQQPIAQLLLQPMRSTSKHLLSPEVKLEHAITTPSRGPSLKDGSESSSKDSWEPPLKTTLYSTLDKPLDYIEYNSMKSERLFTSEIEESKDQSAMPSLKQSSSDLSSLPPPSHQLNSNKTENSRHQQAVYDKNTWKSFQSPRVTDQNTPRELPDPPDPFGLDITINLIQYKLWNDGYNWRMTIESESSISNLTTAMMVNVSGVDAVTNLKSFVSEAEHTHIQNLIDELNARDSHRGRWTIPSLSLLIERNEQYCLLFFIVLISNQQPGLRPSHSINQPPDNQQVSRHSNMSRSRARRTTFQTGQLPTPASSHGSWSTPAPSHTSHDNICAYCKSRGRTVRVIPGGLCYVCRSRA